MEKPVPELSRQKLCPQIHLIGDETCFATGLCVVIASSDPTGLVGARLNVAWREIELDAKR